MTNASAPSPTRPDGLIFDLDGTLVDTVGSRIDGWVEVLSAEGLDVSAEQVGPMIGMDGKRLAREVASANGRSLSGPDAERIDKAAGAAFDRRNREPRPLAGLAEVLTAIEELGLRWLIATSSRQEQVTASVAALGLARDPEIVDGSHVEHAKPAPDLLLLAAERLGLPRGGAARAAAGAVLGHRRFDLGRSRGGGRGDGGGRRDGGLGGRVRRAGRGGRDARRGDARRPGHAPAHERARHLGVGGCDVGARHGRGLSR
jgi:beta-phosphoglucomutase-like phosphatase (HAD superfamily)